MKSISDVLDFFLVFPFVLDHIWMRTACVRPAKRKGLFILGSPLEKELIVGIE